MAGGTLYSIQLQLRVDDSQLDAAIAKLNTLKRAAKDINLRVRGTGSAGSAGSAEGYTLPGGYRRYKAPQIVRSYSRHDLADRFDIGASYQLRKLKQWRFSDKGWQSGLDVFNKRVKTFQDSFFNNLSSLSGLRYNAVNLGKVFTSLGGAPVVPIFLFGLFQHPIIEN